MADKNKIIVTEDGTPIVTENGALITTESSFDKRLLTVQSPATARSTTPLKVPTNAHLRELRTPDKRLTQREHQQMDLFERLYNEQPLDLESILSAANLSEGAKKLHDFILSKIQNLHIIENSETTKIMFPLEEYYFVRRNAEYKDASKDARKDFRTKTDKELKELTKIHFSLRIKDNKKFASIHGGLYWVCMAEDIENRRGFIGVKMLSQFAMAIKDSTAKTIYQRMPLAYWHMNDNHDCIASEVLRVLRDYSANYKNIKEGKDNLTLGHIIDHVSSIKSRDALSAGNVSQKIIERIIELGFERLHEKGLISYKFFVPDTNKRNYLDINNVIKTCSGAGGYERFIKIQVEFKILGAGDPEQHVLIMGARDIEEERRLAVEDRYAKAINAQNRDRKKQREKANNVPKIKDAWGDNPQSISMFDPPPTQ